MSADKIEKVETPEYLFEMAWAFRRSRVVLTAFELGVFGAVAAVGGPAQSGEVARSCGADPRAIDRLLNALCALGLMEKRDGRFVNTPFGEKFLVPGRPGYMSGLGHQVNLWESWSTLTEAVRAGGQVQDKPARREEVEGRRAFIAAMHQRAMKIAPGVVAKIDLSGVRRILDVGGGSGVYSMAFVRAGAGLSATVLDLPQVTPLAREYIVAAGLSDRVTAQDADYHQGPFGTGYDLAFLSAILHSNSPQQNQALLARAAAALNPGGRVVVQEFIMDEDRVTPVWGALFALNMLVNTAAGDTFTQAEIGGWLEAAGLVDVRRVDVDEYTALMTARKP